MGLIAATVVVLAVFIFAVGRVLREQRREREPRDLQQARDYFENRRRHHAERPPPVAPPRTAGPVRVDASGVAHAAPAPNSSGIDLPTALLLHELVHPASDHAAPAHEPAVTFDPTPTTPHTHESSGGYDGGSSWSSDSGSSFDSGGGFDGGSSGGSFD